MKYVDSAQKPVQVHDW